RVVRPLRDRHSLTSDEVDAPTLVARATRGDSLAWTEVVRRYESILHATARRFRLTPEEHEDAVQRTWQRALEHLPQLRNAAALPGWLATTVRHECLAVLRARSREAPAGDLLDSKTISGQPDLVEIVIHGEETRALHRAVKELPGPQRDLMQVFLETPV